jgi:hypothetical protein
MNKFNKKSLCVALAATGLLGAGGAVEAVNLSPDGTGNVLIYPYYTTRANASGSPFNTYLSVVNTTGSTKAVKVRFSEGKNSAEVLDFNVFLSPFDMWTGGVIPNADGGASILTYDLSCTIPRLAPGVAQPFRNLRYATNPDDGGGTTLDRTKEGYIEVFELATYAPGTAVASGSLHSQATGIPANCSGFDDDDAFDEASPPQGGLIGMGQLINPGLGASMSYLPVALDNFYPPGLSFYADTGTFAPNMGDADVHSAVVSGNTLTVSTGWPAGEDAVSAVLMHNAVMNEYVLENSTLSKTDWVVTFPTKRFYVFPGGGPAIPPFENNFSVTGACDEVLLSLWDREERQPTSGAGPGPDFSPKDPLAPDVARICWEANVITFNSTAPTLGVLGSKNVGINVNTNLVPTPTTDFAQNGWLRLGFGFPGAFLVNDTTTQTNLATGVTSGVVQATYAGLPVVGFNVFSYTNSALKVGSVVYNAPVNYGMGVDHRYGTSITTLVP